MITVRCKECGKEITSVSGRTKACGCSNMTTVTGDVVSAIDLTRTIVVRSNQEQQNTALTSQDLAYQEKRRKRKVRKLNFETR